MWPRESNSVEAWVGTPADAHWRALIPPGAGVRAVVGGRPDDGGAPFSFRVTGGPAQTVVAEALDDRWRHAVSDRDCTAD